MAEVIKIDVEEIVAGNNDRTIFDRAALEELADSIREHGLIQPITVRMLEDTGLFEIVAGERRYRACRMLGWSEIPAAVADLTAEEAAAVMLAENLARADLDPMDEANAYRARMDRFGWTVDRIAEQAGVSQMRIRFRLKLLSLSPEVQSLVRKGILSMGYGQILADAGLDANRQRLAVDRLRDNRRPTTGWFRSEVGRLLTQQAQGRFFEDALFDGAITNEDRTESAWEPAHPSTTVPPKAGESAPEVLGAQIDFWNEAAQGWARIGRPFKKQECQAAAQALQLAMSAL